MNSSQKKIFVSAISALTTFFLFTIIQPTIPNELAKGLETNQTVSVNTYDRDEPFLGEITTFAGHFPPRGWAFCDGQLLDISRHSALFSILGTTYGGDGRTTFALPDLRGRVPIHVGGRDREQGERVKERQLGAKYGAETITPIFKTTQVKITAGSDLSIAQDLQHPVDNMQPSLGVNYIIAIQGFFPSRS